MIITTIVPNIDEAPQLDLRDATIHRWIPDMEPIRICGIPRGTAYGETVVAIMTPLPDGGWCMSEIKVDTLIAACQAIKARCGNG